MQMFSTISINLVSLTKGLQVYNKCKCKKLTTVIIKSYLKTYLPKFSSSQRVLPPPKFDFDVLEIP